MLVQSVIKQWCERLQHASHIAAAGRRSVQQLHGNFVTCLQLAKNLPAMSADEWIALVHRLGDNFLPDLCHLVHLSLHVEQFEHENYVLSEVR